MGGRARIYLDDWDGQKIYFKRVKKGWNSPPSPIFSPYLEQNVSGLTHAYTLTEIAVGIYTIIGMG